MHLEVYAVGGEKLFDKEIRGANVFDWRLQNGQEQRLTPGDYVCVVTAKNLSGRITQKMGTVSVGEKEVRVGAVEMAKLTYLQEQAIGPIENDSSWTILDDKENPTTAVLAHDGDEGQIVRGRGALTFRLGNFFNGTDKEQMRLTEDGNLGIGTAKPKVKLDVAGVIRAREGFMFADGSTLKLNEKGVLTRTSADGVTPSVTTTQNQLAKFTDNAGTVGDSVVTELAGSIGIGTNTPTAKLDVLDGRIVTTGSQTLAAPGGILEIGTTVTNNDNGASGIRMRNTFNGSATLQQALDVAPTFAPSASISLARGFISTAFFAPPPGVL